MIATKPTYPITLGAIIAKMIFYKLITLRIIKGHNNLYCLQYVNINYDDNVTHPIRQCGNLHH